MGVENDGIYVAYMAGEFGTSLGMFVFRGTSVQGADLGGGIYDGDLSLSDEGGRLIGKLRFSTTKGGNTITGAANDLPVSYDVDIDLQTPVTAAPFHTINTINGPVNVRFERVRKL